MELKPKVPKAVLILTVGVHSEIVSLVYLMLVMTH